RIFAPRLQNLDNIKMPEYNVAAIRFGLSLNFEVYRKQMQDCTHHGFRGSVKNKIPQFTRGFRLL
ncbi:MAG: hypothetical protein ACI3X4_08915, partial [Bacteroidaceae bacterium]